MRDHYSKIFIVLFLCFQSVVFAQNSTRPDQLHSDSLKLSRKFHFLTSFKDDRVAVKKNNRIFYINKEGKKLLKLGKRYDFAWNFYDGKAKVIKNNLVGYIGENGKEIIAPVYESGFHFHNDIAKVGMNGKYGFINSSGEIIIPLVYDRIQEGYYHRKLYEFPLEVEKDGKTFKIDKTGKCVEHCQE